MNNEQKTHKTKYIIFVALIIFCCWLILPLQTLTQRQTGKELLTMVRQVMAELATIGGALGLFGITYKNIHPLLMKGLNKSLQCVRDLQGKVNNRRGLGLLYRCVEASLRGTRVAALVLLKIVGGVGMMFFQIALLLFAFYLATPILERCFAYLIKAPTHYISNNLTYRKTLKEAANFCDDNYDCIEKVEKNAQFCRRRAMHSHKQQVETIKSRDPDNQRSYLLGKEARECQALRPFGYDIMINTLSFEDEYGLFERFDPDTFLSCLRKRTNANLLDPNTEKRKICLRPILLMND